MKVDKSYLKSKQLWLSVITIIAGFFPKIQELVAGDPEKVFAVIGALFGIFRVTSDNKKLVLKE